MWLRGVPLVQTMPVELVVERREEGRAGVADQRRSRPSAPVSMRVEDVVRALHDPQRARTPAPRRTPSSPDRSPASPRIVRATHRQRAVATVASTAWLASRHPSGSPSSTERSPATPRCGGRAAACRSSSSRPSPTGPRATPRGTWWSTTARCSVRPGEAPDARRHLPPELRDGRRHRPGRAVGPDRLHDRQAAGGRRRRAADDPPGHLRRRRGRVRGASGRGTEY